MKKSLLICVLCVFCIVTVFAKAPKKIDPATITEPVQLTSASLLITTDVDTENKGKGFIIGNYPDIVEVIVKSVKEQSSIEIDPTKFLDELKKPDCDIQYDKLDLGGTTQINRYTWKKTDGDAISPCAVVCVFFVISEDQTMPATVTIYQKDSKSKRDNELTIQVPLKIVTNAP